MDNSSKYCMAYSSKWRATFATVGLTRLIWRFKNGVFIQAKFIFNTFFTISLLLQVFISRCFLTLSECPNPAVSWLTHPRWLIHYRALMFALQDSCVFISKAVFNRLRRRKYFQPRCPWLFPWAIIYIDLSLTPLRTAKDPSTPVTMGLSIIA